MSAASAQHSSSSASKPWILAVDIGTTSTVIATRVHGGSAEVVEVDGQRTIPSVVFVDDDGTHRVGTTALQLAGGRPDRAVRAPKRRLDDDRPIVVAGLPLTAVELVSALVDHGAREALRRFGEAPAEVRLTHPAEWPERIQRQLADAATRAGLANLRLIPEPIAAAHGLATDLASGSRVAIYDLGGETFDTVVLEVVDNDFRVVSKALGSRAVGGELLDEMLMEMVADRLAPHIAEALVGSDDPGWARANTELRSACRAAKESVSSHSYAEVALTTPAGQIRERLERSEIEQVAQPLVAQTMELLERVIREAGDVHLVHLVGGGSRMPLVASMIRDRFPGVVIDETGDPRVAVAVGAAALPLLEEPRSAPPTAGAAIVATHLETQPEPFGNRHPRIAPAPAVVEPTPSRPPAQRGRLAMSGVLGALVVGLGVFLGMQMINDDLGNGSEAANAPVDVAAPEPDQGGDVDEPAVAASTTTESPTTTLLTDSEGEAEQTHELAGEELASEVSTEEELESSPTDGLGDRRRFVVGATLDGEGHYVITTDGTGKCAVGELAVRPRGVTEPGPTLIIVATDTEIVEGPQGSMLLIERCDGQFISLRSASQISGQLDPDTIELVVPLPGPVALENVGFDFVSQRLLADARFTSNGEFQEVEINLEDGSVTELGPSPARPRLDVNPGGLSITDSLTGESSAIAFGTLQPFVDESLSAVRPSIGPINIPASCGGVFDMAFDYGGVIVGFRDGQFVGWQLTSDATFAVKTDDRIGLGSHVLDLRLAGVESDTSDEDGRLIVRFADEGGDEDFGIYLAEVSGSSNNDVILHMTGGASCEGLTFG